MKYYKSSLLLLKLLHFTLLQGVQTEKPEVTGYVGRDAMLPCHLTKESEDKIVQVEWKLLQPGKGEITIVVSNGTDAAPADTFLKDRVMVSEESLKITNVTMKDAGSYTCILTTFPSGSLKRTINLIVQETMSLSPGVIAAIVISVILMLVLLTAIAYCFFIRRLDSFVRQHVVVDTDGPVRDVLRPSVLVRESAVVYSEVKYKPSTVPEPSSSSQHEKAMHADDVTYSEVIMSRGLLV